MLGKICILATSVPHMINLLTEQLPMGNERLMEVAAVRRKCSADAPIELESTKSVIDSVEDEVSLPTKCSLPPPPGLGRERELFTPAQIRKIRESERRDFE